MPAIRIVFFISCIAITAMMNSVYTNCSLPGKTSFRDLGKKDKMDVYKDAKRTVDTRISDLLKQMTIKEKAGPMFINPRQDK